MDDPRLRSLGEGPRRPPQHGGPARRPRGPHSHRKPFHHRGSQDDLANGVDTDGAVLFLYACLLSLSPPGRLFMKRNKVQDLHVSDFMSTELVTASPDETLGDVLGKMKSNDIHELPVLDRKKLVGVVTMRELMRRRNIPPNTKVSTVLEKPPEINPETPLPEAAEKMISAGFRAIPVMKGKGLLGIISRSDIVRALVENRALEGVRVSEFMTPNPQAVAEDDTVDHAVQIMRSLGERAEGHLRRDLRGHPEGDASDRAARATADPRDPLPEVQAGGRPLEVLAPRAVHDEPPDLLCARIRLGPPGRVDQASRHALQADCQGEGTQGHGAEAAPRVNVGSRTVGGPGSSRRSQGDHGHCRRGSRKGRAASFDREGARRRR